MTSFIKPGPLARGLITLYTSTLMAGMWSMIVPAVPVVAKSFGVSAGTGAQVITALAVGRFAGMPISGAVLDHLGTRSALVVGPALGCVAGLIAASAPWFTLILAVVFLMGVAESVWVIAREVSGIDLARPDQRGRVLSGFHGINNVGLALGPLFGGMLTENFGFRATFAVYAICAAASVLIGFSVKSRDRIAGERDTIKKRGNFSSQNRGSCSLHLGGAILKRIAGSTKIFNGSKKRWQLATMSEWLRGLRELFYQIEPKLRSTYLVLTFATFTSFVHRATTQSMLPLFATSKLGLMPKDIGLLFTISGFSVFAMILPAGFVIDKIGRKWATVPSTGIPAVAFLLIPFAENFLQLSVLLSFLGMANGLSLGSLATSTYDVAPPAARGRLQAARRTMAETGSIGAPLLGGLLADAFSPGLPFLVYAPLLVLSAVLLAVVARETLDR